VTIIIAIFHPSFRVTGQREEVAISEATTTKRRIIILAEPLPASAMSALDTTTFRILVKATGGALAMFATIFSFPELPLPLPDATGKVHNHAEAAHFSGLGGKDDGSPISRLSAA
jgi:hypothetical protein